MLFFFRYLHYGAAAAGAADGDAVADGAAAAGAAGSAPPGSGASRRVGASTGGEEGVEDGRRCKVMLANSALRHLGAVRVDLPQMAI